MFGIDLLITPPPFFVNVADKGLSVAVRRPIFSSPLLSACTNEACVFQRGEKKSRAGLKPGPYILRPLGLIFLRGLRRTLAGRILRMAALPARWQARHMYQLATVR